jgi:hypothetical protein
MPRKSINLEVTSTKIISYVCLSFGLLLSISVLIPNIDNSINLKSLFLGVGCSLIASSIVILITSNYTFRYSKVKDLTERWGLYGIYESRQEMNNDSNIELKKAKSSIDIMAWGLSGLRSIHDDLIKDKVRRGLKIRILCPNQDSPYVLTRALEEGSAEEQIRQNILDLKAWIIELRSRAPSPNNVEMKCYTALPQDHYMRIDRNIYIGPYLFKKLSQQTISFSFKYGEMYEFYTQYFNKLWEDETFSQAILYDTHDTNNH